MIEPEKIFTVAVTGHRPNRMTGDYDTVEKNCLRVLEAIRKSVGAKMSFIAVSALAEGSDRRFAWAALAADYRLQAVLPFAEADYEATFARPERTPKFHELLRRSETITVLDGNPADFIEAYGRLGDHLVERADVLVAIWDGFPAVAHGGTRNVMSRAVDAGKLVISIRADGGNTLYIVTKDRVSEIEASEIHRFLTQLKSR
jgi:hypothetical protein